MTERMGITWVTEMTWITNIPEMMGGREVRVRKKTTRRTFLGSSANRDCSAHSSPVPLQQRRRSHSEVPPLLVTVPKASLERFALSNKKGSPALPPSLRQGVSSSPSPSDRQQKAFPPRSPRSNLSAQALRTSSLSPDSPAISPRSSSAAPSAALSAALAASGKAENSRDDLDSSDEEFLATYCHITGSPTPPDRSPVADSPVTSPPSAATAGSAFRGPVVRVLQKSASYLEERGKQRQAPVRAQAGRAQALAKSQEALLRKGGASGGASGTRDAHARVRAQEAADVPQRSYTAPSAGGKPAPFAAPFAAVIAHQNLEQQKLHLKKQLQQAHQLRTAIGGGFSGSSGGSSSGCSGSGLSGSELARGLGHEFGGKQAGSAAAAHGARGTGGNGGASSAGPQAQPANAAQGRSRGIGGHADTPAGGAVSAGARKLFGLGSQSHRILSHAATTGGAPRALVRGRSWASLEFQRAQDPPLHAPQQAELAPCAKGLPTIESSGSGSGKEHAGRRAGATAQEGAEAAQLSAVRRSASARYQPASRLTVDFSAAASAGLTGGEKGAGGGGCGEGKSLGRSASDKAMGGGEQARMIGLPSISGAISGISGASISGAISGASISGAVLGAAAAVGGGTSTGLVDLFAAAYNRGACDEDEDDEDLFDILAAMRSMQTSPHSPSPLSPLNPCPPRSPVPLSPSPANSPHGAPHHQYSRDPSPAPRAPPVPRPSSPPPPPLLRSPSPASRSPSPPSRNTPQPNHPSSLSLSHPNITPARPASQLYSSAPGPSCESPPRSPPLSPLGSSSASSPRSPPLTPPRGNHRRSLHIPSRSMPSALARSNRRHSARRAPSAMARQEQPGDRGSDEAERLHPDRPFEANHMNGQANHAESHEGSRMLNGDSHVVVDVDGSVNGIGVSTNGAGKHSTRCKLPRRAPGTRATAASPRFPASQLPRSPFPPLPSSPPPHPQFKDVRYKVQTAKARSWDPRHSYLPTHLPLLPLLSPPPHPPVQGRALQGANRQGGILGSAPLLPPHTSSPFSPPSPPRPPPPPQFKDVRYKVQTAKAGSWDPRHSCLPTLPALPALLTSKRGGAAGGGGAGGGAEAGAGGKAGAEVREKEILHGISGSVAPGEVLAMMGPSGGGKTTFLNVLGGRFKQGNMAGTLTYNDLPYSKALKRKLGFVTQDDIFFPHLTVRETLMYAAVLRLPKELSWAEKVQRADETITELGLDKCRNTVIGGPFLRGISGGERKRVSIGHEILINPSMLLLDEPTSGLDSTTALRIIQVIQNLAKSGRTVVTTIHQPSSRLFHAFDKLLLLSEGNAIFFGQAADAMGYFGRLGFEPLFAMNPADFLLDLATGTTADVRLPSVFGESEGWQGKSVPEQQHDVKEFVAQAHREQQQPLVHAELAGLPASSDADQKSVLQRRGWTAPWLLQFSVLWTRGLKERRHEVLSPLRFYQVTALGFICGMLWFGSERNTATQIQDQVGLLFFISIFWGFFPLFAAIFTFPQERAILAKERASDMYRLSAYYLSRQLSDLPMEWLLPTLFLLISYFMASLKLTAGAFFGLLFSTYLIVTTAQGCGLCLGAAVMDVKVATTLASVLLLTFMLAGGYYLQTIPAFISWIKYISFTYYAYRLIIKTQFSPSDTYQCGPSSDPSSVICPISNAPSFRGFSLGDAWVDVVALLVQVAFYRGLGYFALRRMKTNV
ncbi:unnamed protein product [Closterium sp. Yama58-4]|nr:unnamed protein product [Closterium sp. Yama58-4]